MPIQRRWRILRAFEWSPKANVVVTYRPGEIHDGLTRDCRAKAGDRIEEIGILRDAGPTALGQGKPKSGA